MSKLKRLTEEDHFRKFHDDPYHCCRWCHYYQNGKCIKDNVSIEETAPVWKVAEEGHLSETLEEFFGSVKLEEFRELEYKLREWKVSEKRIKEFNDLFKQCYDQWVLDHKDELDNTIDRCYQNHLADEVDDGVYINDPEEYCCKEWC